MSIKSTLYQFAVDTSVKVPVNGDAGTTIQNVPTADADAVLSGILNSVYYMVGIAAVISLIVGGIMYATSGGDSNMVTKAKNIILYAVIGIVVTIMAFAITGFVINKVG
jgi:heme/copper-type cytochrome/quinol oxidase subunit 2